jgi:hypothetical protein
MIIDIPAPVGLPIGILAYLGSISKDSAAKLKLK